MFQGDWHEIYDFIEFCLENFMTCRLVDPSTEHLTCDEFSKACNYWLEREMSAWRIVGKRVTRITSPEEIEAVEAAIILTDKYEPVSTHIATAQKHLCDRKTPDYRNSIKEAISAVESMCCILTNDPKATLGNALKRIEQGGIKLHPSLKKAFDKLYGYTCDEGGIRHSFLDQSEIDFAGAKFMLVSCSAFVNLLKERSV